MSVVSIRSRLERAINKLPDRPESVTLEQIEARNLSNGGKPQEIWDWFGTNPGATDLERVIFISGHVRTHEYTPDADINPWTEQQALKFLVWQAESKKMKPRYFRY
jgi:hypothetical protein